MTNYNYNEIWNEICYRIKKYKDHSEADLQLILEDSILAMLNWKQSKGEVERPMLQFGSTKPGKPDAVLTKDKEKMIVIELKKPVLTFRGKNEEQLFSYMTRLKLRFGFLLGEKLNLYYDDILDKESPKLIKTLDFNEDNSEGIELVEYIHKDNFDQDNFENYCKSCMKNMKMKKKILEDISWLCSNDGIKYIKELLSIEYTKEVIDALDIRIMNKTRTSKEIINDTIIFPTPVCGDFQKKDGETVQEWYKRILKDLYKTGKLSEEEINNLHNKTYSKDNFGINYPILCDTNEQRYLSGQARYYTDKDMVGDKYYICHELCNNPMYERKIYEWLSKILGNGASDEWPHYH